jgi:hypothetical protein
LLDLVRDPQQDHYRIRAEVRHVNSDMPIPSVVGIYLAHRAYPGARGEIHLLTQLAYNDVRAGREVFDQLPKDIQKRTRPPNGSLVHLFPRLHSGATNGPQWDHPIAGVSGAPFHPVGGAGGPWRQLEVTVTPEGLRATWDGQPVGNDLPISTVVNRLKEALDQRSQGSPDDPDAPFVRQIPSDFPLRGSLGLYVDRGSARFRSIRIEPLAGLH